MVYSRRINSILSDDMRNSSDSSEAAQVWTDSRASDNSSVCSSASSIAEDDIPFAKPTTSTSQEQPATQSRLRPLFVRHGSIRLAIPVQSSVRDLMRQLREEFLAEVRDEEESEEDAAATKASFLERFISFVLERTLSETVTQQSSILVLDALVQTFEDQVCNNDDVHTTVSSLSVSPEVKRQIVSTIIRASHLVGRSLNQYNQASSPNTALFQAVCDNKAAVYAIFGGQGTDNYLDSLSELFSTYEPLITPLLLRASSHLRQLIAVEEDYQCHFPKSLDLMQWLRTPETRPDSAYLSSAPVSFPLIGLLQLAAFEAVARLLHVSPAEMGTMLSGATGHSQGIVTAAVIAASNDWDSFHALAMKSLGLLLSIGCRSQSAVVSPPVRHELVNDSVENGEGTPSSMLSVRQLPLKTVQKLVQEINGHLPASQAIKIALHNGRTNFVLAGPPASLYGFNVRLRSIKAAPEQDQARVPFDKRKPVIVNRFLPISAPFHSTHVAAAVPMVLEDVKAQNGLFIRGSDLRMPVYSTTASGMDLRQSEEDIVPTMVNMIIEEPLYWSAATKLPGATHIIDFGPGLAQAGAGGLVHSMKEGSGARVLNALRIESHKSFGGLGEFLARPDGNENVYGPNWSLEHAPSLVRTVGKKALVGTKMSRMLGLPPIMVAGMTPTTCSPEFVAAIMNAGYHVEFATGGYHDPASLEAALRNVAGKIPAGRGITCNLIYANPTALQWQLTLLRTSSADGSVPIDGLTFGAGVPSVDVANDYISSFPQLKHMSFKPGNQTAIRQVVAIAKANPTFPVVLQWTGGRAGGHHSFEDFHEPMLQSYAEIRSQQNITLVAGSGFGDVDGSYPYLSGEWSRAYDMPAMPFDGILMGSRVMTAKEAKTSLGAKQAIVQAAGAEDSQWTGTYKQPTGGVITVISEMGEPIHVLATRGMKFWAELDATIFSVKDKAERAKKLSEKKAHIIAKLNADYSKVWFGKNAFGVADLEDMTYAEVIERLVETLYIADEQRWVHASHQKLVVDFIRHAESRFITSGATVFPLADLATAPAACAEKLIDNYSRMGEDIISYQDAQHFLSLCRRRGQKPVPFVPALDDHFETWFKKDSLWQSEDLAAVPGKDVGRIQILQGPIAAKYAKVADEPVKEMLDSIHTGFINRLTVERYHGRESSIPFVECFLSTSPATSEALLTLGGKADDWRQAFFTAQTIVQDKKVIENPVQRLFQEDASLQVSVEGKTISLSETTSAGDLVKVVEVRMPSRRANIIEIAFFEYRTANKKVAELVFKYKYTPEIIYAPIHEITEGRDERIRSFYRQVWFGNNVVDNSSVRSKFHSGPVKATAADIKHLATTLDNVDSLYSQPTKEGLTAPMDFGIIAAWKPLMQPLFAPDLQGDLLNLVHLSNSYRMAADAQPIAEGDVVETTARVTAVVNQTTGKMIEIKGRITRNSAAVMDIESKFFFRGAYKDHENTFRITEVEPIQVKLESPSDVAVLRSKSWFSTSESALPLIQTGSALVFHLQTESQSKYAKTTGWVEVKNAKGSTRVGAVNFTAPESRANPVLSYLARKGKAESARVMFDAPRALFEGSDDMIIDLPASNETYANASGDYNPIHVSKSLASYASLPGTITHGMYASGRVRAVIEQNLHSAEANFFKSFSCSFTGMMLPGDQLEVALFHTGMIAGTRIIKFEVNKVSSGETVLVGEAEVAPPKTAYVFTGQGSQKVGMGMELYATSAIARDIWDRADAHFLATYGLRITHIVKNNPKELTVQFGGKKGRAIRRKYMDLVFTTTAADGSLVRHRCFPEINEESDSYTFSHPSGLLSATQFTQPALTLMEIAAYRDLASRGLVSENSSFAGHSLGEYSALFAVGELLPIEALMTIVFCRGLTMQFAVERDAEGRSEFGMCAVNPSRLSTPFGGDILQQLSSAIATATSTTLEVVNYNIAGQQYVCAGHLSALKTLGDVLNYAHKAKLSIASLVSAVEQSELNKLIASIVARQPSAAAIKAAGLARGIATIPLPGIDVPFHSSYLKSGVSSFRRHLYDNIPRTALDLEQLKGKYIPNLTAQPFELSKEYFENVLALTGSKVVGDVMSRWEELERWTPEMDLPTPMIGAY